MEIFVQFDITKGNYHGTIIGGPKTYATWGGTYKGPSILLANNNLTAAMTATGNDVWNAVCATQGKASGKWVFEATYNRDYYTAISIATDYYSINTNTYFGSQAGGASYISGNQGYFNGTGFNPVGTYLSAPNTAANTPIMVALDLDAGKAWLIANGTSFQGDPVAGTNPVWSWTPGRTIFPGASLCAGGSSSEAPRTVTANFGATAFTNTVPSGFNSGWYE